MNQNISVINIFLLDEFNECFSVLTFDPVLTVQKFGRSWRSMASEAKVCWKLWISMSSAGPKLGTFQPINCGKYEISMSITVHYFEMEEISPHEVFRTAPGQVVIPDSIPGA